MFPGFASNCRTHPTWSPAQDSAHKSQRWGVCVGTAVSIIANVRAIKVSFSHVESMFVNVSLCIMYVCIECR